MSEIIRLFLKLGAIGFGGPIALIGFMEEECVHKKKWISHETFQTFVAVSKLFPGPFATLVAIRIGRERGGTKGGIAAGVGLILPAFILILILASATKTLDSFPFLNPFWLGLTIAALVVAAQATVNLTKPLFKYKKLGTAHLLVLICFAGVLTYLYPRLEAVFIFLAGFAGLFSKYILPRMRPREVGSIGLLGVLFLSCFRASLFTFGSGIAIVPVLKTLFLDQYHLISSEQFLKGLTLAQITPGPIVILSTYLGFVTEGVVGAIVTTVGTFLPTFIFAIFIIPRVEQTLLQNEKLQVFFSWLLPAVCGAIFGSLVRLTELSVVIDGQLLLARVALLITLLVIQLRFKLSPGKVFLLGGFSAYLIR